VTKLLIVDDSDDVRRSVHAALADVLANITIEEAASAAAALAIRFGRSARGSPRCRCLS
jgi:hypothetical protein